MLRELCLLGVVCVSALSTKPLLAGVWTSGGSELVKDAANPWFIENTTAVETCIIYDPSAFVTRHGSLDDVRDAFQGAVEYWKKEFAKSWSVADVIHVATQTFQEVAAIEVSAKDEPPQRCPPQTKLTLQFGWLSQAQQKWFSENGHRPGDVVAIAVRTDYDRTRMVGKGFVFVAGEEGPWAIKDPALVSFPWKRGNGVLLAEVLKHEVGHVFGVPHIGLDGPMASDYAEKILQKENAPYVSEADVDRSFFKVEGPFTLRSQCYGETIRKGWRDFLGAPRSDKCLEVHLEEDSVTFWTGTSLEALEKRGVLRFEGQERYSWQDAVRVYAPPGQKAIACPDPKKGAGKCPWLLGPMIKITDRAGTFRSEDGKLTRQVAVTLSPLGVGFAQSKFSVEIDGIWHWNLDWEY
jgi:hypothetical protein